MSNHSRKHVALEVISTDGKSSVVLVFQARMKIGTAAEQIAEQQGLTYISPKQYIIADAYTGMPYDSDSLVSQIPEFSSIRLLPTGAAAGYHYLLKRFSLTYILWFFFQLALFTSALFKFPTGIYDSMTTFTWILWDAMLFAMLLAALIGTVKSDLVYVTDPANTYKRLEAASKQGVTIVVVSLTLGSLVCATSFQLGLGGWISVVRGAITTVASSIIVIIAAAFANED